MEQLIINVDKDFHEFDEYLEDTGEKTIFLICGKSIEKLSRLNNYFNALPERLGIRIIRFGDFKPNPTYESVVSGVNKFRETKSHMIIAVGGGSAIDVAKCIKLFSNLDPSKNYLMQEIIPNNIRLVAIPTTAGTGSETTRFAVIYYKGQKQSVTHSSIIPETVLFDESVLDFVPDYYRKSAMLDALCHAIESYWCINSTDESKHYSEMAINGILTNYQGYLNHEQSRNKEMQLSSYFAGKAINITETTAGHALCYKLTSKFNIAHGHAAALVNSKLWPWMIQNADRSIDKRGANYLKNVFNKLAFFFGVDKSIDAVKKFSGMINELDMKTTFDIESEEIEELVTSVNFTRLKNNPVELSKDDIRSLYCKILRVK